jgi:hypothetical protein
MQSGPDADDGFRAAPPASGSWRRAALLTVLALALCGLAVSAAEVVSQVLPRRFTAAQQRQIEAWEMARRWRALPEGVIFPATVTYQLPGTAFYGGQSLPLTARRLAVGTPAGCASAADAAAARVLGRYRCAALLRATYTDSTGSMVATVGVAVLRDSAAAAAAQNRLSATATPVTGDQPDGVRAAPVAGTLASRFRDRQRQLSVDTHAGPYVIMATVGYTDGRPRVRVSADSYLADEMDSLAEGLDDAVTGVLGRPPRTPACPGAPGC